MADSDDPVQITAQCLCKQHTHTAVVPRSSLPLIATACHCTSCRRCTGALYSSAVLKWPGDDSAIRDSSLKRYDFSDHLTVLFCGTCSSPMFFEMHGGRSSNPKGALVGQYGVMTGALSNDGPDGLVRIENHVFVGDTKDGGMSMFMRTPNGDGKEARRWMGLASKSEEVAFGWPAGQASETEAQNKAVEIPIRCHCGGVDLSYQREKAEEEFQSKEKSELPWFVHPETNKLMASIDPCDSCRMSSGVDFWPWTFVLLRHIGFASKTSGDNASFPDGTGDLKTAVSKKGPDRDPRLGTLEYFASSEDVQRYFCSRCSASVFYALDERPEMVDLAVGLLDSEDGARAESLLCWSMVKTLPKLMWRDDMLAGWRKHWLESVEAGAEAYRKGIK
ncbi:hypothetical protein KVR01_001926 [Diaporthe batatas]|uniref:uncharacterized protein n=1 Tax=Diaporthe batatas TaxID=748121 RepID=UPI001D050CB4|nr:uncharacterized protein KVR01_001926 [Diaporthe batatas]KAG8169177.1 hypothetical protein KVR01_001926 [Diaporthe batatas]